MARFTLINDHFQNWKPYSIPKAQLVIADIPFNIGKNAYGSNPAWYVNGDNANGESDLAGKGFFDTDNDFKPAEFMHFCSNMLKREPKERNQAPCMVVFCEFEQQFYLFRNKLPKFNNDGKMIFNCMDVERDNNTPKIHPTQKSVKLLEHLIKIFTDPGEVVIDPVAGSGTTLLAAMNTGRVSYGFEIKKPFYNDALKLLTDRKTELEETEKYGLPITKLNEMQPGLFTAVREG